MTEREKVIKLVTRVLKLPDVGDDATEFMRCFNARESFCYFEYGASLVFINGVRYEGWNPFKSWRAAGTLHTAIFKLGPARIARYLHRLAEILEDAYGGSPSMWTARLEFLSPAAISEAALATIVSASK